MDYVSECPYRERSTGVCVSLAGGEFLTGQSTAFLLGGDVMRTSSPLADRQPCLCSPLEEKPHCVSEYMCVWESMNVCASLSDCVIGSWGWWGSREALERVYFSPHPFGEKGTTYWCLPLKGEVSHVFQSTVAAQTDCAAVSDCPLLQNSLLREAEFFAGYKQCLDHLIAFQKTESL